MARYALVVARFYDELAARLDRRLAVGGLADHHEVRKQPRKQLADGNAGKLFVVHDQDAAGGWVHPENRIPWVLWGKTGIFL